LVNTFGSYTIDYKGRKEYIYEVCMFNEYFLQSLRLRLNLVDSKIVSQMDKNTVTVKFTVEGYSLDRVKDTIQTIITDREQKKINPILIKLDDIPFK